MHVVVCLGGECSLLDLDQSIKLEGREMLKEEERKALYGKLLLEHVGSFEGWLFVKTSLYAILNHTTPH